MGEAASTKPAEMKIRMSDATALGVFGLAMVTLVASSSKLGWTSGTTYVIPWAIFLGSIAQIWAARVDFRNNNYFGSIVLGAYGLFWMAVAVHWAISLGWFGEPGALADTRQIGFAYIGYLVFSLFITVAACEVNKLFAAILVLIDVLFVSLAISALHPSAVAFSHLAAYAEFSISILGFYTCGAIFLNNFFGKQVLPLGKPFGFIKKAA